MNNLSNHNLIRQITLLTSILIAALVTGTSDCPALTYDVYLLAGQSNMDGRGDARKLAPEQLSNLKSVKIFYRNPPHSSNGWKPLATGFSIPPKYKGKVPSSKFGPEIGFANEMLRMDPSRKIAIIKASEGGTNLRKDWNPGEEGKPETQGSCYLDFCKTYQMATDDLKKEGIDFQVRGLLWHQGESDSKSRPELYKKRFYQLVDRIRDEIAMQDLPVVVGEVFDNGKRDNVREALRSIGTSGELFGLVSAEGTSTWDEGTHFNAASQLMLGKRYAEAVQNLQTNARKTTD